MVDRAQRDVAEVALVAEQLVAVEDLLGDLLGRAGVQRALRRAQRLELLGPDGGQPRSRPMRFIDSR